MASRGKVSDLSAGSLLPIVELHDQLLESLLRCDASATEGEQPVALRSLVVGLLFLRLAEGRGLQAPDALTRALAGGVPSSAVEVLLEAAAEHYGSKVFQRWRQLPRKPAEEELLGRLLAELASWPGDAPVSTVGQLYQELLGRSLVGRQATGAKTRTPRWRKRKAGGVFYTPSLVVDDILDVSLSPILEGGGLAELHSFAIIDPACGAGSFLVGSHRRLMHWYLEIYRQLEKPPPDAILRRPDGQFELTPMESARIAQRHIFGIDIDVLAQEVAGLSLLLSCYEGHGRDGKRGVPLAAGGVDKVLRSVCANLRHGNALVDSEVLPGAGPPLDWQQEFPAVFSRPNPGFDLVVGNPPYVDAERMTTTAPELRTYCAEHFQTACGNWDLFCVFCERGLELTRSRGLHAFVVPNKLASAEYAGALRELLGGHRLVLLRDYSRARVFGVEVYPLVYVVQKRGSRDMQESGEVTRYEQLCGDDTGVRVTLAKELRLAGRSRSRETWPICATGLVGEIIERRSRFETLAQPLVEVRGAATVDEAYRVSKLLSEASVCDEASLRFVNSGTIDPYRFRWGSRRTRYLRAGYEQPVVSMAELRVALPKRYEQARTPKVVVAGMTKRLEASCDSQGEWVAGKSTTIIIPHAAELRVEYLTGVLNSSLMTELFCGLFHGLSLSGGYLRVGPPQIRHLPLVLPQGVDETRLATRIEQLVGEVSELWQRHDTDQALPSRTKLLQRVRIIETEVDNLVGQLYAQRCQGGGSAIAVPH